MKTVTNVYFRKGRWYCLNMQKNVSRNGGTGKFLNLLRNFRHTNVFRSSDILTISWNSVKCYIPFLAFEETNAIVCSFWKETWTEIVSYSRMAVVHKGRRFLKQKINLRSHAYCRLIFWSQLGSIQFIWLWSQKSKFKTSRVTSKRQLFSLLNFASYHLKNKETGENLDIL
jgi:hypothetical protein